MLNLIGLGLYDEKGLTLEGIEICKKSHKIYIETYTSKWNGSINNLKKIIGKEITNVNREDLENKLDKILDEAKIQDVSILVPGDPLIATTHLILIISALKLDIKTRIIHNSSIYSAISETGLHIYKFGGTVTIPFEERTNGEEPSSVFEKIIENKKRGLHTLCLLDLISEEKKYMTPNQAMKILLKSDHISEDNEVVVFCRAGCGDSMIKFGKIKNLIKENFGSPPFVLIVPGKLHFTEEEYLKYYSVD